VKGEAMDMDRFVNDENLNRLRKLASVFTTEDERKILFGLLADEKTKFIELQKARIPVLNSNWGTADYR
jgi:hypothetical protein